MEKEKITVRFDKDILEFFRKQAPGRGYQSLMNEALKEFMVREQRNSIDARVSRLEAAVFKERDQ